MPSALSVRTLGLAVRPVIRLAAGGGGGVGAGAGGGTGGGASLPPIVPAAGSTSLPEEIVHTNGPLPADAELHVQSTICDVPDLWATTVPFASFTVTVHGSDEERRDWKRTSCPTAPLTTGAYSFGSPVCATRCAIEARSE